MSATGILLLSASHARAHAALFFATEAAGLGRPVVLFAAGRGALTLCRDWSLLDEVGRDAIVRRRGVAGIGELREQAQALAVRLLVCENALRAEGIAAHDLEAAVEVANTASFLDAVGDGPVFSF